MRRTAIVVLGYVRIPSLVEVLDLLPTNLLASTRVYLDFKKDLSHIRTREVEKVRDLYREVLFIERERHLGLVSNLFMALDETFETYDNCIIIEDDIRLDEQVILSATSLLNHRLPQNIMALCFFPGINNSRYSERFVKKNMWRATNYFCPWGWAIQKEEWEKIQKQIDLETELIRLNETFFFQLRKSEKVIWMNRFLKVQSNPDFTYDTQVQFSAFLKNKRFLAPIIRSADNVGFGDSNATHTKDRKPNWYKSARSKSKINETFLNGGLLAYTLNVWDSFTVGGIRKVPKTLLLARNSLRRLKSLFCFKCQ